jgi:hypothetical protein
VIRREQGRLVEIRDLVRAATEENQGIAGITAMLADTCTQLGDVDEARALLDQLTESDFGSRPRDQIWSSVIWSLAETAVVLADEDRSRSLYDLLAPYPDQLVYNGLVALSSTASVLGRLALALGELDDAEAHFGHAIEIEAGMQAPILVTRSRLGLARVYLARGTGGDAERGRALLGQVLDVARERGFAALEADALATKGDA